MSQATLSFGAKDAKERHKKKEKEYEYILDDEIEFVQALKMPGTKKDDGLHVNHELTQEELAQLVGASRETVNKALADFASRGWVKLEPRAVIILDYERLVKRGR